jgi:hypothetical protein
MPFGTQERSLCVGDRRIAQMAGTAPLAFFLIRTLDRFHELFYL